MCIFWDILKEKEPNKAAHSGIMLKYIIVHKEQLKIVIYLFGQECTHLDQTIAIL